MTTEQDRPRGSITAFFSYYLRTGYLLAVIGVPVAMLFEGGDGPSPLFGAAAAAVLTLLIAIVSFRRRLKAAAYTPPSVASHLVTGGDLPMSACTPADRLERRRGLALIWWAGMILSGIVLVWGAAQIFTADFDDPTTLLYIAAAFLTLLVWLPAAILFVWSRPVLARNARLAARHPDALILTAFVGPTDTIAAGIVLRRVCGLELPWWRARVPMLSTLLVDASGIGWWRGGLRPHLRFHVPWDRIGTIAPEFVEMDMGSADSLRLGIGTGFRVHENGEPVGWLDLSFLATRSNTWVAFPYRSHAVIEAVAKAIEARRPHSRDLFRGLTLAEVREGIDELTAAGDQAALDGLLDELRAWISARGGAMPAGSDWLTDLLAGPIRG